MTLDDAVQHQPTFSLEQAEAIAKDNFGFAGPATALPSERDQNFLIDSDCGRPVVLKIANPLTDRAILELENQAIRLMQASGHSIVADIFTSREGQSIVEIGNQDETWCARVIGYLPGLPLAAVQSPPDELRFRIGVALGQMDDTLTALNQVRTARRSFKWDLARGPEIIRAALNEFDFGERAGVLKQVLDFHDSVAERIPELPRSVIHNDANDHNIIVNQTESGWEVAFIDFGDMLYSATINDLAICLAYLILGAEDPVPWALPAIKGYHSVRKISPQELSVLFPLLCTRLAQSVCICRRQKQLEPHNEYLTISERPAWEALERLVDMHPQAVLMEMDQACRIPDGTAPSGSEPPARESLLRRRERLLSPSLSLSYDRPLHIVRGRGQYLFDSLDRTYLDCVNNVCHVGHCHPKVVEAAVDQIRTLNTNTRYLHENILDFAEQLTATLPESLEVCFFVNSGSEANDLALRLARTFTGQQDVLVVDHAYHGHVSSLIELSPYKFNSPGGTGKPKHVHIAPMPDGFRGPIQSTDSEWAARYASLAVEQIDLALTSGRSLAAFIAEPILGCGGQMPLPEPYLSHVYQAIRKQGGVCISDEVQVGFGRVGSHFWGFQQHAVVPDIVTLGKPIGNGHPLGAVVTTRAIADAFNNGMEYFNTFGGNPVSCAIGAAVLNVIHQEGLQEHAHEIGAWLVEQWEGLAERHPVIGQVRGSGLFLGMELVDGAGSLQPDADRAHRLVQRMRQLHVLLSTDGPDHNVIKFKPPMVFDRADAERVVMLLDKCLGEIN